MRFLPIALLSLIAAGCTTLGGEPVAPPRQFVLAPEVGAAAAVVDGARRVVAVAPTQAEPGYAGRGMAYTREPFRLEYFSLNEWADAPARMLDGLIVRALEGAGLTVVGPGASARQAERLLDTQVQLFRQEFEGEASFGHVALRVQLSDAASGKVIATRTLSAREPATGNDPAGGVAALNRALAAVLSQLAGFVVGAAPGR